MGLLQNAFFSYQKAFLSLSLPPCLCGESLLTDQPLNSLFQDVLVKVNQQTNRNLGKFEVGQ